MPKALELYKKSDVYKAQIARQIQRKREADETRTAESTEKKVDRAQQILAEEPKTIEPTRSRDQVEQEDAAGLEERTSRIV